MQTERLSCPKCGREIVNVEPYLADLDVWVCSKCGGPEPVASPDQLRALPMRLCRKCNKRLAVEKHFTRKNGHHQSACDACLDKAAVAGRAFRLRHREQVVK